MKKTILLSLLLLTSCNSNNLSSLKNSQSSSIIISKDSSSSFNSSINNTNVQEGYLLISIPQDQIYYQVNDLLDIKDIEIYLVFINDYSKIQLNIEDVIIESVDMSIAGEKKVNVSYKQYTGYFIIYVGSKLESPSNLSINSLENKVSWSKVDNASKYQIRISDYNQEYGVYEVEDNYFYYDKYNLLPGDYRFEVKSISDNIDYYNSDYSSFINIHIKEEGELEPLSSPTGLNDDVVSFSWNANNLVEKWVINISKDTYVDEFEVSGNINKIVYKDHDHFKNLNSGIYNIKIKGLPKNKTIYSESNWSISTFRILEEGEKVKLGTPFGLVDAGTYAMLGYLANAKTFGVKIYSESNEFIKEVETVGLTFEYKRDLQIDEGIYNLYIYAKGYDLFLDSDLYGPCRINYKEV